MNAVVVDFDVSVSLLVPNVVVYEVVNVVVVEGKVEYVVVLLVSLCVSCGSAGPAKYVIQSVIHAVVLDVSG